jgi:hypothetical protein
MKLCVASLEYVDGTVYTIYTHVYVHIHAFMHITCLHTQ